MGLFVALLQGVFVNLANVIVNFLSLCIPLSEMMILFLLTLAFLRKFFFAAPSHEDGHCSSR